MHYLILTNWKNIYRIDLLRNHLNSWVFREYFAYFVDAQQYLAGLDRTMDHYNENFLDFNVARHFLQ